MIMCENGQRSILASLPARKLADVLAELSPLPDQETLPDMDDLTPLDSDQLS